MNFNWKIISFFAITAIVSCKPDLDEPRYSSGEAVFTRFVSIGDDFGSGFSDGALTSNGQISAVPNFLSSKFQLADGSQFSQAYMQDGNGAGYDFINNSLVGNAYLSSYINCQNK